MKENILQLKNDIKNIIEENKNRNEIYQIRGVKLSRVDLDGIDLYCDILLKKGNLEYLIIYNEIKDVFNEYNIKY